MATFNFADQYRTAGFQPTSEIVRFRQLAAEKIITNLDDRKILDLVRLYFGSPVRAGGEWFVSAFSEDDASFSMVDNEREASVLSACILESIIESGNSLACLAVVTMSVNASRKPIACPDFIDYAANKLLSFSIYERDNIRDFETVKIPNKSKFTTSINEYKTTNDQTKAIEAINYTYLDAIEASKFVANELKAISGPLVTQVRQLREEVDMLWWHIGGHSNVLHKPFPELEAGLAAILAGVDLANLSRSDTGPAAAPAMLYRAIMDKRDASENLVLSELIDSIPETLFNHLTMPEHLPNYYDFCPVLAALSKYHENAKGAWMGVFKKITGLESNLEFTQINLSLQVYREILLLALID